MTMILIKIEEAFVVGREAGGMNHDLVVIFRTPSEIEASVDPRSARDARHPVGAAQRQLAHGVSAGAQRPGLGAADCGAVRSMPPRPCGSSRAIATTSRAGASSRSAPSSSRSSAGIGYRFKDRGLLEHALTHRSRVHEDASGGVFDNESMEFLGDSVLGFVIAAMLFREFPQHNEGQKSKLKASLVSAASLARLAERLDLGTFLILGRGEEKTGGRRKHAIIADCYEALIAAIYLDGGIEPAQRVHRAPVRRR